MSENHALLSLIRKFLEQDTGNAARLIENMTEEEGAEIIKSLPPLLAVQLIKHFQVSYAAFLLKDADEAFLRERNGRHHPLSPVPYRTRSSMVKARLRKWPFHSTSRRHRPVPKPHPGP